MLTVTETAKKLHVSREAILKYINIGVFDKDKNIVKLKAIKEPSPVRKIWLISHNDIEDFIKQVR